MRRKHEMINGCPVSCWDDGENVADRYTVVFLDSAGTGLPFGTVQYLAMSAHPFRPQGFGQHGAMPLSAVAYRGRGGAFRKRIKFADLPPECQCCAMKDLRPNKKER